MAPERGPTLAQERALTRRLQPVPEPVEGEDRKITINYVVDPKKRTYARQIRFRGNTGTNDETLRRELARATDEGPGNWRHT